MTKLMEQTKNTSCALDGDADGRKALGTTQIYSTTERFRSRVVIRLELTPLLKFMCSRTRRLIVHFGRCQPR